MQYSINARFLLILEDTVFNLISPSRFYFICLISFLMYPLEGGGDPPPQGRLDPDLYSSVVVPVGLSCFQPDLRALGGQQLCVVPHSSLGRGPPHS